MIEKGLPSGQINLTESVENYPGFESISGFDLSQKFLQHTKSYGLEMIQHIGFVPNNQLVPAGIRMDQDGYMMTDERCETNIPESSLSSI